MMQAIPEPASESLPTSLAAMGLGAMGKAAGPASAEAVVSAIINPPVIGAVDA
jgi:hypothetical protein